MIRIFGVVLTVLGCGSVGFQIAANHRREEKSLQQLIRILEYMECELQYRMTPLPELCRQVGQTFKQTPGGVFIELASEMESQISPDINCCMSAVLQRNRNIPKNTRRVLSDVGVLIGRFDLIGQIKGLNSAKEDCKRSLAELGKDRDTKLRNYQTLGLCAGAALAILLI